MNNAVHAHIDLLRQSVFQCDTLWPQFRLLLDDLQVFSEEVSSSSIVVSLERTLLYGGFSLIAPLFQGCNFISIDCSPPSAEERGAYNSYMVNDPRFIRIPLTHRASIYNTGLPDSGADLVLVPNLVHHIADQHKLFEELHRIVRPGGKVYVFEPLVREIHQAPDDFLRYTPHGLELACSNAGLQPGEVKTEGGPFQVISYCWTQALQYIPDPLRQDYSDWFHDQHFPELLKLDAMYTKNLTKKYSSFPLTFSMTAHKPIRSAH